MYRGACVVLIGLAGLLAGCGTPASQGGPEPQLVRHCQQTGFPPGSKDYPWCLQWYSLGGRGEQLDLRLTPRAGP